MAQRAVGAQVMDQRGQQNPRGRRLPAQHQAQRGEDHVLDVERVGPRLPGERGGLMELRQTLVRASRPRQGESHDDFVTGTVR